MVRYMLSLLQQLSEKCLSVMIAYGSLQIIGNDTRVRLFDQESEFERADLVISNKTISKSIKSHAIEKGWALVHYSELGIWLRDNYRMGVFKEF